MQTASSDTGGPSAAVTMLVVVLAALLWIVVAVELLLVVPGYERVFADFQLRVPLSTEWVIAASRWSRLYFYFLALPFAAWVAGVGFSIWWIRRRQRRVIAAAWCIVMLLVPLILAVGTWLVCYLPFQQLLDALGPRNG